jgi:pimeloyl-ACP methyl ester carboxylesterase
VIVYLHGVPETAAVWRKVQAIIGGESVALSLPGFGNPLPAGFEATPDGYVDWIVGELHNIDEPIDLVGHDFGAAYTYRIVTAGLHPVRSWVVDIGNILHPDYDWHDIGKLWQTPGDGEAFVAAQNALPREQRAGLFEALGVPHDDALEMADYNDATMGACILSLYRAAMPNAHALWGPWSKVDAPGMVMNPTQDMLGDGKLASEVAEALGARYETFDSGHFWPYQAPETGAAVIQEFWASL